MAWREYNTKKEGLMYEAKKELDKYGTALTLRQLYYRLVAQDIIENKQSQYQYLSEAVKQARLKGIVEWWQIEDRTRHSRAGDYMLQSPETKLKFRANELLDVADDYHRPLWEEQNKYVELWYEKEALANYFDSVASRYGITSFASRGYTGWTSLKEAYDRFSMNTDKECIILYFGDYDPSGMDIQRFIDEKLNTTFGLDIEVKRIGLTKEQIEEYQLPPQPAKSSDSRYDDFVASHGNMAVEVDALEPNVLKDLVRSNVKELYDRVFYQEHILPKEEEGREFLQGVIDEIKDVLKEHIDLD